MDTARTRDHEDDVPGLAEKKAARKLTEKLRVKVEPDLVISVAKRLWDARRLAAERDERVHDLLGIAGEWNALSKVVGEMKPLPDRSLQAHRGHVTRALVHELEPEVEKEIEARKRRRRAMAKEKRR